MTDYKWIRFWGQYMGSQSFYVDAQVERAKKERAPANAIYRDTDGWKTTAQIENQSAINALEKMAGEQLPR